MNGEPASPSRGSQSQALSSDREPEFVSRIGAVELTSYSGPLPHPEVLRRFDEVYPGAAERIFKEFEEQSAHRRAMERKVINSDAFSQIVGSISSGVLGLVGVCGGLWLVHEGLPLGGLSSLFATLASLLSVYIYQNRKQQEERSEKNSAPPTDPRK